MAIKGVLNLSLTVARNLNIRPSEAMAYNIRGRGNIAPSKLVDKPAIAPAMIKINHVTT